MAITATVERTWTSQVLRVCGTTTRVLEAGDPDAPAVVLIHYGGYGSTVEEAWEYTIPALAREFRVVAPEQLGFGASAKVFDFADPLGARVRHIAQVLELLRVESAHFVGVSTAGTMLLSVAAAPRPAWPIDRIVGISAVGERAGGPDVRAILQGFDGSFDAMDAVIGTMYPERCWDDAYVERRLAAVRAPGVWQCVKAEQLRAPWEDEGPSTLASDAYVEYERIVSPVLLVGGGADKLRRLDQLADRAGRIADCTTHVFAEAGHVPHIQCAGQFNALALEFLRS